MKKLIVLISITLICSILFGYGKQEKCKMIVIDQGHSLVGNLEK